MKKQSTNTSQKEPVLFIRLMGEPHIQLGENKPVQFQYRKSIALLAFLAAMRKSYSREFLADLLWETLSEKNAQAGLRKSLTDINKSLPNALTIENHNIAINISSSIDVDVFKLEQALLLVPNISIGKNFQNEIEKLEDAISTTSEIFMNGFVVQNAPAFDNWLFMQREQWRNSLIKALTILSEYTLQDRQYHKSMEITRRLLEIEPALEEAHYNLMSLLLLDGQRSMALKQFEICKQALLEMYDSLPQERTINLYNRIRSESDRQKTNRKLPLPATPIIGREEDINNVCSRLQDENCRIVSITGPGGIGKTHLSLMIGKEITQQSETCFEDGVVFVPLQAVKSIHSLSSSIASQLGYSYEKESDPVNQLCNYLAPYKMLLILDNFEDMVVSMQGASGEQYNLINRILQAAPGVKLLVTSRIRLNFQGEFVYPLQGISFPKDDGKQFSAIRQYPAIALFIRRAEQLVGLYHTDEAELQAIIDICQHVNGLPLGILLAAGWTNLFSAREIAEKLNNGNGENGLDFLATGGKDMPVRHRDMEAVFRQSWGMISTEQQKTLAALSIFPSSVSIKMAQDVAQAKLSDLRILIDHSLLERNESGRLQMHDLLRQYASNQGVDVRDECEKTCQYFSNKVIQWEEAIRGDGQVQAIHEMNLEIDNLRAIWDRTIANKNYSCARQMFEGLCQYYAWRHYYAEGVNFCSMLVKGLESEHAYDASFTKQDSLLLLVRALTWQSSFTKINESGISVSRGLEILDDPILKECDTRSERAFACYWKATYLSQTGKHAEAFQLYRQSMQIYEELQDEWHLKDVYIASGILLWDKSEYPDAQKMMEQGLIISRKIGDQRSVAHSLLWLGNILLYIGDSAGEKMVRESLSIFAELGDQMGGMKGKVQACSSLFILGMYEEACELMENYNKQEVYDFRQDSSNMVYAISLIHTGQYEEARIYARKGMDFARELGEEYVQGLGLITEAWLCIHDNDLNEAEQLLTESLQHSQKYGIGELVSWSFSLLAINRLLMGKEENVMAYIRNAIQLAKTIGSFTSKVFVLSCITMWLAFHEHAELCFACYSYTWQYPLFSNSVWWQDHVGLRVQALTDSLSESQRAHARKKFNGMPLDEVLSILLNELESK